MNKIIILIATILSITLNHTAQATDQKEIKLLEAKQQGLVGEQLDGMIGIIKPPGSKKLIKLKKNVNDYRLKHYRKLAAKSGQSLGQVQLRFGKQLTTATGPGFYYKDQTGRWHLK